MTDIVKALWDFWGQFEINGALVPVYQTGTVPDDAVFPYITFDPAQGDAMATLPLVATVWVRYSGENTAPALAQRSALLEAVSRAIPYGGTRLPLPTGFLLLYRGSGDFLTAITDDEDKTVLGGRVGYEVLYCTT